MWAEDKTLTCAVTKVIVRAAMVGYFRVRSAFARRCCWRRRRVGGVVCGGVVDDWFVGGYVVGRCFWLVGIKSRTGEGAAAVAVGAEGATRGEGSFTVWRSVAAVASTFANRKLRSAGYAADLDEEKTPSLRSPPAIALCCVWVQASEFSGLREGASPGETRREVYFW